MDALVNTVKEFCLAHGCEKTYWIAYSGGLDSHVLLHLFAALKLPLRAIYINHGLSPNANLWAEHCSRGCRELQIDFLEKKLVMPMHSSKSPEEMARDLRYGIFAEVLPAGDMLLTAHHADDQAETVLLQMLRGAGPKGLAAMPPVKPFANGFHGRPLLHFTREELTSYAKKNQLQWIEDESNFFSTFARNFLRHEVMPVLKKRWPSVTKTLGRVAENCAAAQYVLDDIANDDLKHVIGSVPEALAIEKLAQLTPERQSQVIRRWLTQLNFPLPSLIKMQHILGDILTAATDKAPHVSWSGIELRRYRNELFVMSRLKKCDPFPMIEWNFLQPLILPNGKVIQAKLSQGQGLCADIEKVAVRFRQNGETVQLAGRKSHHSLKKLFQEWGVPPWERAHIPLIYLNETLIEVVGFFKHEKYSAQKNQAGYVISIT